MEVDLVLPRSEVRVTLSILTAVVLSVVVTFDPLLEHLLALSSSELLRISELHLLELVLCRNVEQAVATVTIVVEVGLLIHCQRIATTTEAIVVEGYLCAHPTVPVLRRLISDLHTYLMRDVKLRPAHLVLVVRVAAVVVLPVRISHRRRSVVHTIRMTEDITCHQVETKVECLLSLDREVVRIALVGVAQIDDAVVRKALLNLAVRRDS